METFVIFVVLILAATVLIARAMQCPHAAGERYSTSVGRHQFRFELVPMTDGTMRIYILRQPSYGHRSAALADTHRYRDGDRYYVCIKDHLTPRTNSDARSWADYWSKRTAGYIADGRAFS